MQNLSSYQDKRTMQKIINDPANSPDHILFREFLDNGNFQNDLLKQTLQVSFMPEKGEMLPSKFNIRVESDKHPVSFRSSNPVILHELICQLSKIYFQFFKNERSDLLSFKIKQLQDDIRKQVTE